MVGLLHSGFPRWCEFESGEKICRCVFKTCKVFALHTQKPRERERKEKLLVGEPGGERRGVSCGWHIATRRGQKCCRLTPGFGSCLEAG